MACSQGAKAINRRGSVTRPQRPALGMARRGCLGRRVGPRTPLGWSLRRGACVNPEWTDVPPRKPESADESRSQDSSLSRTRFGARRQSAPDKVAGSDPPRGTPALPSGRRTPAGPEARAARSPPAPRHRYLLPACLARTRARFTLCRDSLRCIFKMTITRR